MNPTVSLHRPPPKAGDAAPGVAVVLPDGRRVRLRRLELNDEAAYRHFVQSLSARSQYYRFFSPRHELTEREIHHFLHVDHVDREAIVADHGGEIVALGRYDRMTREPSEAEVAFVVRDDFQGQGIAPRLLRLLAMSAHRHGIRTFVATVLPDNRNMLKVFAHSGWLVARRLEDGTVIVTLDIDRPEVRGHAG